MPSIIYMCGGTVIREFVGCVYCCCCYLVSGSKPCQPYPEWSEKEGDLWPVWFTGLVRVWAVWWRQCQHILLAD